MLLTSCKNAPTIKVAKGNFFEANGGTILTVQELCETVKAFPAHTEVTVYVEGELTVSDHMGDRIDGFYSGMLGIEKVACGELFTARGVTPTMVLKTGEVF